MKRYLNQFTVALAIGLGTTASVWAAAETGTSESDARPAKAMNVRVNALALAVGSMGADVDFGIGEGITLGPSFSHYSASVGIPGFAETSLSGVGLGVRANLYLNGKRFTDGWLVGPYAKFLPMTLKETIGSQEYSASMNGLAMGALFTHQWIWNSGFNINLGGGIAYYGLGSEAEVKSSSGEKQVASVPAFKGLLPNLELTMGYAF